MNRRTLLKGSAATALVGALGLRRPSKSFAARRLHSIQQELPQYELIDLFVNDAAIEDNGTVWRGVARDIANDGSIIGETVGNGVLNPTIWDSALNMSYLDMGQYAGTSGLANLINSSGLAGGQLRPIGTMFGSDASEIDFERVPLVWQNGVLVQGTEQFLPSDSIAQSLSDDGLFAGEINHAPARWRDSNVESLEVPAGFSLGSARALNSVGDAAGAFYLSELPYLGATPFIWRADGSVELQARPGDRSAEWEGTARAYYLGDDGVAIYSVVDGAAPSGQVVRYENGVQTVLADLYGQGATLSGSNASGVLVGQSALSDVSVPTMWIDEQPMVIADFIIPGPDRIFTSVQGINDAGALVGDAVDSAGISYSVLLQPM